METQSMVFDPGHLGQTIAEGNRLMATAQNNDRGKASHDERTILKGHGALHDHLL